MARKFNSSNKIHVVVYQYYDQTDLLSAHTTLKDAARAMKKLLPSDKDNIYLFTWDGGEWIEEPSQDAVKRQKEMPQQ